MKYEELKQKATEMKLQAEIFVKETELKARRFAKEHPYETMAVAAFVGRLAVKEVSKAREYRIKTHRMYDHSLNCWLHLRRPLRSYELTELSKRRANGERLVDILNSMDVLC